MVSYRLVTVGTVEEKMTRFQLRKVALARTILNMEAQKSYSSRDDLKDLFSLSEVDSPNLLLRVIQETSNESFENSIKRRLEGIDDPRVKAEILAHVMAFDASYESDADLDIIRMVKSSIIAGCSDRAALFSREDISELEEAVRGMTIEEKEQTSRAVEEALGWLSVKNKNS